MNYTKNLKIINNIDDLTYSVVLFYLPENKTTPTFYKFIKYYNGLVYLSVMNSGKLFKYPKEFVLKNMKIIF